MDNLELKDMLQPEQILLNADLAGKDELLRTIARLAKASSALDAFSIDDIYNALVEREEIGSTGYGEHVAIPHCHLENIDDFVIGLVTVAGKGVDFAAVDDKPVKLAVFIIAPKSKSKIHVRLLSTISQALMTKGIVAKICGSTSTADVRRILLGFAETPLEPHEARPRNVFQVVVQDRKLLPQMLQVFTALDAVGLCVVEGRCAHSYLSKLPLFAGLWTDDEVDDKVSVIQAAVDCKLSNEAIRRIEHITGPLDRADGISINVVQSVFSAGSQEF